MDSVIPTAARPSWRRSHALWLWLATLLAIGLLRAGNRYLVDLADDRASRFAPMLIEEIAVSLAFGVFLPVLFLALRRMRWTWPTHVALFAVLSVAQTSLMIALRVDYPPSAWRYLMEVPTQLFFYVAVVAGIWLFDRYREEKARELRAARLEAALAETRLDVLRLQLNPHFLFNTLHVVSELMYERPRVADEMLSRVGELLRATLSAAAQEHRLAEEWRLVSLYTDIQRVRFGEGLDVRVEGDSALDDLRIPFLLLQPLVENAIEHGAAGEERRVHVDASRDAGRLTVRVRDYGGGAAKAGHGIGLGHVIARLRQLYGDEAGVHHEPVVGGGSIVSVWLPARRWEAA